MVDLLKGEFGGKTTPITHYRNLVLDVSAQQGTRRVETNNCVTESGREGETKPEHTKINNNKQPQPLKKIKTNNKTHIHTRAHTGNIYV